MGVISATPDSFSDGGQFADTDAAISFGEQLIRDGADIIDVGGGVHSSRCDELERRRTLRIVPIISGPLRGIRCSVDTMRAGVAAQAVEAALSWSTMSVAVLLMQRC